MLKATPVKRVMPRHVTAAMSSCFDPAPGYEPPQAELQINGGLEGDAGQEMARRVVIDALFGVPLNGPSPSADRQAVIRRVAGIAGDEGFVGRGMIAAVAQFMSQFEKATGARAGGLVAALESFERSPICKSYGQCLFPLT